jgi:hypothetical protein
MNIITYSTNHAITTERIATSPWLFRSFRPKGETRPTDFPESRMLRSSKRSELRGNRKEKITRLPTDRLGNQGTSPKVMTKVMTIIFQQAGAHNMFSQLGIYIVIRTSSPQLLHIVTSSSRWKASPFNPLATLVEVVDNSPCELIESEGRRGILWLTTNVD